MFLRRKRSELGKLHTVRAFDSMDVVAILQAAGNPLTAQQVARAGNLLDHLTPGEVFELLSAGMREGVIERVKIGGLHRKVTPAYTVTAEGVLRWTQEGQEG